MVIRFLAGPARKKKMNRRQQVNIALCRFHTPHGTRRKQFRWHKLPLVLEGSGLDYNSNVIALISR